MPTAQQVSNPVNFFGSDDNGVIVELPAVSGSGATTLSGSLVFGINTQSNNTFGSASVATASADYAYVQATYNGTVFDNGALDSGSNAVYFTDNSITTCTHSRRPVLPECDAQPHRDPQGHQQHDADCTVLGSQRRNRAHQQPDGCA